MNRIQRKSIRPFIIAMQDRGRPTTRGSRGSETARLLEQIPPEVGRLGRGLCGGGGRQAEGEGCRYGVVGRTKHCRTSQSL